MCTNGLRLIEVRFNVKVEHIVGIDKLSSSEKSDLTERRPWHSTRNVNFDIQAFKVHAERDPEDDLNGNVKIALIIRLNGASSSACTVFPTRALSWPIVAKWHQIGDMYLGQHWLR